MATIARHALGQMPMSPLYL